MVGARRYSRQGAGCAGGGGSVPDIFSFDECAWFASLHLDLFPFLYLVSDLCAITLLLAKESQLLLRLKCRLHAGCPLCIEFGLSLALHL